MDKGQGGVGGVGGVEGCVGGVVVSREVILRWGEGRGHRGGLIGGSWREKQEEKNFTVKSFCSDNKLVTKEQGAPEGV